MPNSGRLFDSSTRLVAMITPLSGALGRLRLSSDKNPSHSRGLLRGWSVRRLGNPAAARVRRWSARIEFPFRQDGQRHSSIGGTRNCDVLHHRGIARHAGRYSIHEEDREEWLGFLSLLKRNRPKAPLNA